MAVYYSIHLSAYLFVYIDINYSIQRLSEKLYKPMHPSPYFSAHTPTPFHTPTPKALLVRPLKQANPPGPEAMHYWCGGPYFSPLQDVMSLFHFNLLSFYCSFSLRYHFLFATLLVFETNSFIKHYSLVSICSASSNINFEL